MSKVESDHQQLVLDLVKPGETIREEMTAHDAHLLHMAIGICGEAGEIIDAIKKRAIYRSPVDIQNIIEELGDLEFYMEGLRLGLQLTREECLASNVAKLRVRYGKRYSNDAAIARLDKQGGTDGVSDTPLLSITELDANYEPLPVKHNEKST